ncbi:MAG: hypothetical protein WBM25_13825, partial [Azonexus sp.]
MCHSQEKTPTPNCKKPGRQEIDPAWLHGKQRIEVSAGASAPEILVQRVVDRISLLTGAEVGQLAGVE